MTDFELSVEALKVILNDALTNNELSSGIFAKITGVGVQTQALDMGTTNKIVNLADPTVNQDAATKKYVDDQLLLQNEIGELTDVVITAPADNEVLAFDLGSGNWINQTAAEAGLSAVGHTHVKADITDTPWAKADLPGTIVYTDQANTFGAFAQRFPTTQLQLDNPAATFQYIFATSAIITIDKTITLPLLTANDIFVFEAFGQTLSNKTLTTPTIGSFVNATHSHLNAAGGGTITKAAISDFAHQADHQSGGSDALTGNLDATARTSVSKNSAADVGARRTLNFIEGSNVTLTIVDDAGGEEVDITIASSGAGSPLTTKGDIFGFTTVDARIPVGANNQVLIADSTPALGVKYALVADANIATHASTKITGLATQVQALLMGGFGITNAGTIQGDTLEVINAGAGTNPTLTSNSATNNLLLVNDQLEINNVGAGTNPIFLSNDAAQVLDLTGSFDISGTLTAGTYVGQSSIVTLGTIATGVWNGTVVASAFLDADTMHLSVAQTISATKQMGVGIKFTVDTDATNAGYRDLGHTADPSAGLSGDLYYNTTSNEYKWFDGTSWKTIAETGGVGEANTISSLGGGTVLTAAVPKSGVDLRTVSIATTAPITHSVTTDLLTFDINDIVDVDIGAHTSTKITITAKGQLNSAIAYEDEANTFTGGIQTIDRGNTVGDTALLIRLNQPGVAGTRDSPFFDITGTSFDSAGHDADWRQFVDVTSNAGASSYVWQSRIDVAAFAPRLTLGDNGLLTMTGNLDIAGGNIINTGTLTLPTATDTLMGKATTDVMTNKSYDLGGTGNVLTGTKSQFDTALSDDDFAYIGQANVFTANQRVDARFSVNQAIDSGFQVAITIPDDTANEGVIIQNSDGSFRFQNVTAVANEFTPVFRMDAEGANTAFLQAQINVADDTGSNVVMGIDVRQNDNTPITTRPLFRIANNNVVQWQMDVNGNVDQQGNDLVNLGTLNTHTVPGGTSTLALFSDNLSVFAATTSLQFIGVISDETGTGLLVFNDTPTILTPTIASFVNATHAHTAASSGGTLVSTTALSDTADVAYLNTANSYIAGNKQSFLADATTAGININNQVPSTTTGGDIWRATDNITYRNNADTADLVLANASNTMTFTNKTIDGDDNTIVDINETQMNVSVGASTTVLTSNGVGVAPTYQAPAGGEFTAAWTADHNQTGSGFALQDARFADPTDATKELIIDLAGSTTAIALTLDINQSTAQTLTIPNITAADSIATLGTAQTFTAINKFDLGTTSVEAIDFPMADPSSAGTRDSHKLVMRGTSFDTVPHQRDWHIYVNMVNDDGTSRWTLACDEDEAGFNDYFTIMDGGGLTIIGDVDPNIYLRQRNQQTVPYTGGRVVNLIELDDTTRTSGAGVFFKVLNDVGPVPGPVNLETGIQLMVNEGPTNNTTYFEVDGQAEHVKSLRKHVFDDDLSVTALKLIRLDGPGFAGNTNISESAPDIIRLRGGGKDLFIDPTNATATTTMTFDFTQTVNRIITFPDAAGTVIVTGLANQITNTELTAGIFAKIIGLGAQSQTLSMSGQNIFNAGNTQSDSLELINAGAGANPSFDSNAASPEIRSNAQLRVRDTGDNTKTLLFDPSGLNTGIDITLAFAATTVDRTLTVPLLTGNRDIVVTTEASQITIGTEVTGASTALTDTADIAYLNQANTFGAFLNSFVSSTMRIPLSATPTMAVDGDFAIDTTITDFSMGLIKYFDGEEMVVISVPIAQLTSPTNGHVITYNSTNDEFELVAGGAASLPVVDTTSIAEGSVDATKEVRFEVDGNTTGIIGVLATVFTTAKTVTFPDATDTLMGKATTDTMTNKSYDLGATGNVLTGSVAEFNTALQSETFAYIGVENNFTVDQDFTQAARVTLTLNRTNTFVSADEISTFVFKGDDVTPTNVIYGQFITRRQTGGAGSHEGQFLFQVADGSGGIPNMLRLNGVTSAVEIETGNDLILKSGFLRFSDANTTITDATGILQYDVASTFTHDWRINNTIEAQLSATIFNLPNAVFQEAGTDISPIGTHDDYFDAGNMIEVTSATPTTTTIGTGDNRKGVLKMDFAASVVEFATIKLIPPRNWDAGTITVVLHWTSAIEAAGTVEWEVSGVAVADGDDLSAAATNYGTAIAVTDTQTTINQQQISPRTAAITLANTPTAGDAVYLKIARDGVTDTFGQIAFLLGVTVEWTINAATAT